MISGELEYSYYLKEYAEAAKECGKIFFIEKNGEVLKYSGLLNSEEEVKRLLQKQATIPFSEFWAECDPSIASIFLPSKENPQVGFSINVRGIRCEEMAPNIIHVQCSADCGVEKRNKDENGYEMQEYEAGSMGLFDAVVNFNEKSVDGFIASKEMSDALGKIKEFGEMIIHELILRALFALDNSLHGKVEFCESSFKTKIKIGSGASKRFVRIRNVVIIRSMASRQHESDFTARHKTEFSHGWWVRGHWRKHDGLGKDRSGNRAMKGMTWVVPYTKNDELGIIEKVRIIK